MSAETIRRIELLHSLYQEHTNRKVPLDSRREHEWFDLIAGIRDMDCPAEKAVVLVADRLKRLIKAKQKWESALDFGRFVGRVDEFQDNLAAALAESRKPKVNPGYTEVMRATGRSAEPKQPKARKADEVLNSPAFKAFCDLRKSL